MKKKLLFVIPSLAAGGGERSLVNLLAQIDHDAYQVDLALLSQEGIFLELLPKEVQLVQLTGSYQQFIMPIGSALKHFVKRGMASLAIKRIMFSFMNRTGKKIGVREQQSWKYIAPSMDRINKRYDAAIGFLEKSSIYFCVEKVDAAKKIGWIHNDYDKLGLDAAFDHPFFEQLDHLVTVSDECAAVLKHRFDGQRDKVSVIHNIVSPAVIHYLSNKAEANVYGRSGNEVVICSIGRLHPQKGFDIAIEACGKLVAQGVNVQWHVIGEGEEREKLAGMIARLGLKKHFHLLGLKTNPYPYIRQADIYAQTSRFEGKSIAVDEAKILQKPILITNFSTAMDQITDGKEGVIVEMDAEAVAEGLSRLISDGKLRDALTAHLSQLQLGTEEEIEKLYKLLG